MIAYILGWIMKLEGLFMLIPVLVALIYREHNGVWFAIVAVCALVFGAVVTHKKPESNVFYMREGCIATAMSWFIMSVGKFRLLQMHCLKLCPDLRQRDPRF